MKALVLTALALSVAGAHADDDWVSVGAARPVAPAAQTSVTDTSSQALVASPVTAVANFPQTPSAGLLAEMSLQMEQMQQEIAELRGLVEEQAHQMRQLKQEQQDRYLDLDRRLAVLMSEPVAQRAASSAPAATTAAPAAAASALSGLSPTDAYKHAQKLMYDKKYTEANEAYEAFTRQYPDEPLAVNAIYWSGEIYLLQGNLDKALTLFRSVVTDHPQHLKVPDAMYKVGYTLDRQGKTDEAKVWMKKVIDQFTGKSDTVVRLAKNYLDSH